MRHRIPFGVLVRFAHWLVIPIALLLLFPSAWMVWGFVAALGLYLARWVALGSPVPATTLNLPILLLLAMVAVGWLLSPAPELAPITAAQAVASVTLFFVLADRLHSAADLWRVAAALVVLGVLFALAAPFTVNLEIHKYFRLPEQYVDLWPRLGKVTNANILAGAIAPIVPIAVALIAQSESRWRVWGAVSLAPMVGMLFLLQSRGALFALAVGLVVWVALYRRWLLPVLPVGLTLALFVNNTVTGQSVAQFLYGDVSAQTLRSFGQRQDIWVQAIYLLRESPLLGIGLGAFPRVTNVAWPHAHNLFLQVALDTGLLGFGAFVALLAVTARTMWNAYRAPVERHLATGILAALTVVVVHGLGDVVVWGTAKSSIVLWIVLALAVRVFGESGHKGYNARRFSPALAGGARVVAKNASQNDTGLEG
ncbi:MAG: O-antigen ligase family protein [Chloroflexi bacterium]|nr:O-antigen ligase family protein [Chloroflexota bacterium]